MRRDFLYILYNWDRGKQIDKLNGFCTLRVSVNLISFAKWMTLAVTERLRPLTLGSWNFVVYEDKMEIGQRMGEFEQ